MNSSSDVPLEYAEDVISGRIVASEAIKGVCERYVEWRESGKYHYDKRKVDEVIRFCSTVVVLQGEHAGRPFVPFPWQQFVLANVYGFTEPDGSLVTKKAWLESAKGSGKLMLSASIGLYALVVESKTTDQQVFVFARDYKQVRPIMDATCNAIRSSERLQSKLHIYGGTKSDSIYTDDLRSKLELFSADSHKGKSGYLPSRILADEAMEWDSGDAFDLLEKNFKSRKNALSFITSNSGTSLDSWAGIQHQHAIRVATGEVEDDSFLPLVYSVDTKEDIEDEAMWVKSNPSLPEIPGLPYIRKAIKDAKNFPASKSEMERLQFGIWGTSKAYWIDPDVWVNEVEAEDIEFPDDNREVVLSLDIGQTRDLTSLTTLWKDDGVSKAIVETWIPTANLEEREHRDNVDYSLLIENGELLEAPGKIMNLSIVAEEIYRKCEDMNVVTLAYDPWLWDALETELLASGVEPTTDYLRATRNQFAVWAVRHKQTFKAADPDGGKQPKTLAQKRRNEDKRDKPPTSMGRSIAEAEMLITRGRLRVRKNAPLRTALETAVVDINADGLKKLNKGKSTKRIDPLISLVMAIGGSQALSLRKRTRTKITSMPTFSPKEVLKR